MDDHRPNDQMLGRRRFNAALLAGLAAPLVPPPTTRPATQPDRPAPLPLSLAQWSLHRRLYAGELDPDDFPAFTRTTFGITAVEYVNTFYADRLDRPDYSRVLRRRAEDAGVRSLLVMIDGAGAVGAPTAAERDRTVQRHRPWLELAAELRCHRVRVNARYAGSPQEQAARVVDGLQRLLVPAAELELKVLVENHGGLSSNGAWLADVMRRVNDPRCGTLPDFGNFTIAPGNAYDRYRGMKELLPWAGAVSAKCYDFDDRGRETTIDFARMLRLIHEAGYRGHLGIEYEGRRLDEVDGIRAAQRLLIGLMHRSAPPASPERNHP